MKGKERIISTVLTIILCVQIFLIPANAISTSFIENHFDMLLYDDDGNGIDNDDIIHTPPSEMSCGYVAMSMILSYYDTYWHDSFVPDEFERSDGEIVNLDWQSGIYSAKEDRLVETFSATSEADAWTEWEENGGDFAGFATNYKENYLQPYLISIGKQLGYHNDDDESVYVLSCAELANVLRTYLNGRGISEEMVEVKMAYGNDISLFSTMQSLIENNQPVIYFGMPKENNDAKGSGEKTKKIGHFLVAYALTDNNEDIKLHTGWAGDELQYVSNTQYSEDNCIIWLDINETLFPHVHSYNYMSSDTNELFCACQIYSSHCEHFNVNNHITEKYYDNIKHWDGCHCGAIIGNVEFHDFSYSFSNNYSHWISCNQCDYIETEIHEHYWVSISSEKHQTKCICGHTNGIKAKHTESQYVYKTIMLHSITCVCGYVFGTATHSIVTDGPLKSHCSECGAVFNTGSDIIIKGSEDDFEIRIE